MFQFADENSAGSCNFVDETFKAFALAVFVVEPVELDAVVRPVPEEETGNLRVALEGVYLVEFALYGNAVHVVAERIEILPNRESGFLDECLQVNVKVLDGLLILGAARTSDVGRLGREERVVREGHEHLVLDVEGVFFAVLELAVAESGIGNHHFFFVFRSLFVETVGQVVGVTGVRSQTRVHLQRGVLRNAVDRHRKDLAGILVVGAFVIDKDTVEVADGRTAHVHGADGVQKLVAVLQHERSVFGTHDPHSDAWVVVLFLDDVVDELLCNFQTLRRGAHGVDWKFLEHQEANLVANVQRFGAERGSAAADGVKACGFHCQEVFAQIRVARCPETAFAPLLVVAHTLNLQDGVVQVEIALDAIELAERERPHHGETEFLPLALCGLVFHLNFEGEHVGLVRAPNALVSLPVLDGEYKALRCVFFVELDVVLEPFVNVTVRVSHEETEACRATARVVEGKVHGDAFLVHVRFHVHVRNKGCVTENEVYVTKDTAKRVLVPRFAHGHFAGVHVAVVGSFLALAAKVDAAVRCAHVGNAYAKDVFFAELDCFLRFKSERRVGAKVRAEDFSVEPNGGVCGDAVKVQKDALGDLLLVLDGKALEVIGAVLGHQKFVERTFPNVRHLDGFRVFGVSGVPAIRNTQIICVPDHLPIAVKAHDFIH